MNKIEIIGIIATLIILVSMSFKTLSFKGSLLMRITNVIGSLIFVIYGFMLPAYSTAILNLALVIVNSIHLYKLVKGEKNQNERKN